MKSKIVFCVLVLSLFGCAGEEPGQPGRGHRHPGVKRPAEEEVVTFREAEQAIRITSGDYYDCSPCWSPDGKKIAYCSHREGSQNIWVMELTAADEGKLIPSGDPRQITSGSFIDQDLSWSSNGKSILFSSNRTGEYGIFEVNLEDNSISDLKQEGVHPRWSPGGGKIAFVSMNNIWTVELTGEKLKQYLTASGYNEYPCWSPDARKIIFSSSGDLCEGSGRKLISSGWNNQPDWSAEKDEIDFVSNRGGYYDLWKMNPDGSDEVQLTVGPLHEYLPRWSPDGEWIVFQADYEGSFDIWVIRSGLAKKELTEERS
jgi:Tol biopolymer transport system component